MVYIQQIMGDRHGSVDAIDKQRASDAAEAVLAAAGMTEDAAYAEYMRQWLEFDDEHRMSGAALTWIEARRAANAALTSTWADPAAGIICSIGAG